MAEKASEKRGLWNRAAPQDASVSDGQSPQSWGAGANGTFLSSLRNFVLTPPAPQGEGEHGSRTLFPGHQRAEGKGFRGWGG